MVSNENVFLKLQYVHCLTHLEMSSYSVQEMDGPESSKQMEFGIFTV